MPDLPTAQVDPNDTGQDDLDTSAWGALQSLDHGNTESAGLLLQHPNGQYFHTTPITSLEHDHFALRAALQKGWKIAGIYHTHPGDDADGQVFSPNDLQVAAQLKVPSYIRFLKDGAVRKYVPGQTQSQNLPSPSNPRFSRKVATGDPVDVDAIRARLQALQQKAAQQPLPALAAAPAP
jgi:proteasome lid subunit RPN8/RPN11